MNTVTGNNITAIDHRKRLLDGMAKCVAEQGYATTTIADIASTAHVSKRTFYEHFRSKQDCLLALYENATGAAMQRLKDVAIAESGKPDWLDQAVAAYFGYLAERPQQLRTLFVEVISLGMDGLKARRKVHQELARLLTCGADPQSAELARYTAAGVIGVLVEFVLCAIEDNAIAELPSLAPQASRIIRNTLEAMDQPAGRLAA